MKWHKIVSIDRKTNNWTNESQIATVDCLSFSHFSVCHDSAIEFSSSEQRKIVYFRYFYFIFVIVSRRIQLKFTQSEKKFSKKSLYFRKNNFVSFFWSYFFFWLSWLCERKACTRVRLVFKRISHSSKIICVDRCDHLWRWSAFATGDFEFFGFLCRFYCFDSFMRSVFARRFVVFTNLIVDFNQFCCSFLFLFSLVFIGAVCVCGSWTVNKTYQTKQKRRERKNKIRIVLTIKTTC